MEEIYKSYFDKLPKEEQLACEVLQASLDTSRTRRPEYAELILEENMHEITENILRLVVKKSLTGESTHYFFFVLK